MKRSVPFVFLLMLLFSCPALAYSQDIVESMLEPSHPKDGRIWFGGGDERPQFSDGGNKWSSHKEYKDPKVEVTVHYNWRERSDSFFLTPFVTPIDLSRLAMEGFLHMKKASKGKGGEFR